MQIYSEPVFRPPAEADSVIIQIANGCPYNRCRFCGMYKMKTYYEKDLSEIMKHIQQLKKNHHGNNIRAFFADGDGLMINTDKLIKTMLILKDNFPKVRQIGIYGSVFSLKNKSLDDLKRLKEKGLRYIYLGIESGDEDILKIMDKYTPINELITQCQKVMKANIKLSVMIILGLGGIHLSKQHATKSAQVLNKIKPNYTNVLNLMLEHTELINEPEYQEYTFHHYQQELKTLIENINYETVFRSNHASNFLPLSGRLPKDREKFLLSM